MSKNVYGGFTDESCAKLVWLPDAIHQRDTIWTKDICIRAARLGMLGPPSPASVNSIGSKLSDAVSHSITAKSAIIHLIPILLWFLYKICPNPPLELSKFHLLHQRNKKKVEKVKKQERTSVVPILFWNKRSWFWFSRLFEIRDVLSFTVHPFAESDGKQEIARNLRENLT